MPATEPTWTPARLELLKRGFEAGLTCREIAADLGVSRNAVIGKLSRLNLTREDENRPRRRARKRAGSADVLHATPQLQQELLAAAFAGPQSAGHAADDARRCSLFELSEERCRWPISTPGAADFCFCGKTPLDGLPYCPAHSRLAYQAGSRQRVARG
jgi:GcrA cell cycle regulator